MQKKVVNRAFNVSTTQTYSREHVLVLAAREGKKKKRLRTWDGFEIVESSVVGK